MTESTQGAVTLEGELHPTRAVIPASAILLCLRRSLKTTGTVFATAMSRFIVMDRRPLHPATDVRPRCVSSAHHKEMAFAIDHLDHLVLTVADVEATIAFYTSALGMKAVSFGNRRALHFGSQKINLHQAGHEFAPKAARPTPGSGDLCFITKAPLDEVMSQLEAAGLSIELGPVERTGAVGKLRSVYLRDPDFNLIEISNYL